MIIHGITINLQKIQNKYHIKILSVLITLFLYNNYKFKIYLKERLTVTGVREFYNVKYSCFF